MAPGSSGVSESPRPRAQPVASATAVELPPVSPGTISALTMATATTAEVAGTASTVQSRDPIGAPMHLSTRNLSKEDLLPRLFLPRVSPEVPHRDVTFVLTSNIHSLRLSVRPPAARPARMRVTMRAAAICSPFAAAAHASEAEEKFFAATGAASASILPVGAALKASPTAPSSAVVAAGRVQCPPATSSVETSLQKNTQQFDMALYEPLPLVQQQHQRSSGKHQNVLSLFSSACWWLPLFAVSLLCNSQQQLSFPPPASSLLFLPSASPAVAAGASVAPYLRHLRSSSLQISTSQTSRSAETSPLLLAGAAPAGAGTSRCVSWTSGGVNRSNAAKGREAGAVPQRRLEALPEAVVKLLDVDKGTGMLIGVLLTLCGSILMAGGSTFMKMGLNLETDGIPRSHVVSFFKAQCFEPLWCAGLAVTWRNTLVFDGTLPIIFFHGLHIYGVQAADVAACDAAYSFGALLHIIALAFAPASVLAPMNSVGLIANAVTAATVLKEPFGFRELLFTGGTAVGVTLCAGATLLPHDEFVNMSTSSSPASADITLQSWRDPWYLAYLACCVVAGFATLIILNAEENAVLEEERDRLLLTSSRATVDFEADRILSPKRSLELARLQQQPKQPRRSSADVPGKDSSNPAGGEAQAASLPQVASEPLPHDKKM